MRPKDEQDGTLPAFGRRLRVMHTEIGPLPDDMLALLGRLDENSGRTGGKAKRD